MARKYYRSEERPISEVLERRKEHYIAQVKRALNVIYERMDAQQIENYERSLSDLNSSVIQRGLEGKISKATRKGPRPKLFYEAYIESRDTGMTDEEIKA